MTDELPPGAPADDDIARLIGLRNELVWLVAEWKRHGYGPGMATRFKALDKVLRDEPEPPERFSNFSKKRALTVDECQMLINGSLLALAWKAGGRVDVRTADIYEAHAALGTIALAISDDDSYITITGMKRQ